MKPRERQEQERSRDERDGSSIRWMGNRSERGCCSRGKAHLKLLNREYLLSRAIVGDDFIENRTQSSPPTRYPETSNNFAREPRSSYIPLSL